MTAPAPSGDRSTIRSLLPLPLLTAALSALAVLWTVTSVPKSAQTLVGCGGAAAAVLLCVAVTVAVHARRTGLAVRAALRTATAEAERSAQERDLQAERWRREHQRHTDATAHERARLAEEFTRERAVRAQEAEAERARLAAEVRRLSEQLDRALGDRDTAIAATANAAARMQALATGTLADLRAMEERHSDEDVLADLLHLDHRTAQAGRLADSVAVLTGARSGRRWARPISMESVLRGAMGRISGYQRIRLHSVSDTAVAGHAAEGVMHALAEVLDNAANFSPPNAEVHVYVEEVPAGAIVSVEDSGLVMSDVQLRRAERAVSGDAGGLGGLTGTRLGLAVVGRLSRKHGMKVSFRPSARGGTGVLILIPQDILTTAPSPVRRPADPPARSAPTRAPQPDLGAPAPADAPPQQTEAQESGADAARTGDELPKRRRGRTLAAAESARAAAQSVERRTDPPEDIRTRANRFGAFRQAVRAAGAAERTGGHPLPTVPDDPHSTPSPQTETAPGSPTPSHPEGDTTS
ncbi:ATP-binding protein [Streptomyces rishiriensis]|uniref:histidine kinase n=1 Tax=Streptomyces rishiriensis TaxID=68264 RepID=A0ABU0P2F2_STRRH|nr:ATP-binding protein [Streptomyces rishiriensis]MDQ0585570.1 signal transduction histidine kinase [Streptomyces rishiriensis]